MGHIDEIQYAATMVEVAHSVLYVGSLGTQSLGRERALVASGIGVATVTLPESAVTYVKNSEVRVVLIDEGAEKFDLSKLAGALKVVKPSLKVVALTASGETAQNADVILTKPIAMEDFLQAVEQNLLNADTATNGY